ncbi:hypothetical protein BaRGS_00038206, partial [Batillaria attramentaria]
WRGMGPNQQLYELDDSWSDKVYLTSKDHCGLANRPGAEKFFSVKETTLFNVQVETWLRSHSYYDHCYLMFRSTRPHGRLCLKNRQVKFDVCQARLDLYDGIAGTRIPNKTADCVEGLKGAEWCTGTEFLTVGLRNLHRRMRVVHMHVDLLVYDIRSEHRAVYMDSLPYCGSHFELDNSQVIVSNLDPHKEDKGVFPKCFLTFEYTGLDENRTVCVEFESAEEPHCDLRYTLELLEPNEDTPSLVHTCATPASIWCSSSKNIRLELQRSRVSSSGKTTTEPYGMFTVLVSDRGVKYGGREEDTSLNLTQILGIGISGGVVLLVAVAAVVSVIVIRKRRAARLYESPGQQCQLPYYRELSVLSPPIYDNDDSQISANIPKPGPSQSHRASESSDNAYVEIRPPIVGAKNDPPIYDNSESLMTSVKRDSQLYDNSESLAMCDQESRLYDNWEAEAHVYGNIRFK